MLAGEQRDAGPPGPGSRFRLTVPFLGARMSLTYEVIRFVPDREVLLRAASALLRSTDRTVVTGAEYGRWLAWHPGLVLTESLTVGELDGADVVLTGRAPPSPKPAPST